MINIYYSISRERLQPELFKSFLQQLPFAFQTEVLKFRKWQDMQRGLLAKLLLIRGLKSLCLNSYSLNDLKFTKFQRPYFGDEVDFNISHSGEYIICAISKTNRIGVDVEEIKDIPLRGFNREFSNEEWKRILQANDKLRSFYTFWTQKEAFLKAIGTGLYVPLNQIAVIENKVTWQNKDWFLHEINLDPRYACHLSTDTNSPEIMVENVNF